MPLPFDLCRKEASLLLRLIFSLVVLIVAVIILAVLIDICLSFLYRIFFFPRCIGGDLLQARGEGGSSALETSRDTGSL